LTPHRLRLRLNARDAVKDGNSSVQNPQRPLDLDSEIDVAWRVDDVDGVVAPGGRRRCGFMVAAPSWTSPIL
jgi:hypothetical protein